MAGREVGQSGIAQAGRCRCETAAVYAAEIVRNGKGRANSLQAGEILCEYVYLFYGPGDNCEGEAYFLPVPRYPAASVDEAEEGTVRIAVHVSPEGKVVSAKVKYDPKMGKRFFRLERAAHKAALEGIYFPAMRDGKPVDTRLFLPFNFILRQDKPSESAASAE